MYTMYRGNSNNTYSLSETPCTLPRIRFKAIAYSTLMLPNLVVANANTCIIVFSDHSAKWFLIGALFPVWKKDTLQTPVTYRPNPILRSSVASTLRRWYTSLSMLRIKFLKLLLLTNSIDHEFKFEEVCCQPSPNLQSIHLSIWQTVLMITIGCRFDWNGTSIIPQHNNSTECWWVHS